MDPSLTTSEQEGEKREEKTVSLIRKKGGSTVRHTVRETRFNPHTKPSGGGKEGEKFPAGKGDQKKRELAVSLTAKRKGCITSNLRGTLLT